MKPSIDREPNGGSDRTGWWYRGKEDVLSDVVASGGKLPLAFMIAAESVMREDPAVVVTAYHDGSFWWFVNVGRPGNVPTSKMSRKHVTLLVSAGGERQQQPGQAFDSNVVIELSS